MRLGHVVCESVPALKKTWDPRSLCLPASIAVSALPPPLGPWEEQNGNKQESLFPLAEKCSLCSRRTFARCASDVISNQVLVCNESVSCNLCGAKPACHGVLSSNWALSPGHVPSGPLLLSIWRSRLRPVGKRRYQRIAGVDAPCRLRRLRPRSSSDRNPRVAGTSRSAERLAVFPGIR
jgi:hypothetical protein